MSRRGQSRRESVGQSAGPDEGAGPEVAVGPEVAAAALEAVDAVFGALAHASRRHILLVLHVRGGQMTAGEIASRFECSWPTTTRHLGVLRDAGLVVVERRGRERIYRLDRERLHAVAGSWLAHFG
ncbi:MAG: metalloregulator ArsR/SmtB family transcription factor [Myxococcota bacterium]